MGNEPIKQGDVIRVEIVARCAKGYVNGELHGTWYQGDRIPAPFSLLIDWPPADARLVHYEPREITVSDELDASPIIETWTVADTPSAFAGDHAWVDFIGSGAWTITRQ